MNLNFWSFGSKPAKEPAAPEVPQIQPPPPPTIAMQPVAQQPPEHNPISRSVFDARSAKQLGLFVAGAGFLTLSTMITRRSVRRRTIAALPTFYQPSHRAAVKEGNPDGPLIAVEALGLATLNVFGFAIMATGGLMWGFDISNIDDLRQRARKHTRGGDGEPDEDAEKSVEEWMAKIISRVEGKKENEAKQAASKEDESAQ